MIPNHAPARLLLTLLACLVASASMAQTYKCTDAKGAISYQQIPCPGQPVEANQVAVKPVPLIGGSTAQTGIGTQQSDYPGHGSGTRSQYGSSGASGSGMQPQGTPQRRPQGNEITWCRDRAGQHYPTAPGGICSDGSTPLPPGTTPDLNRAHISLEPIRIGLQGNERYMPRREIRGDPRLQSQHLSHDRDDACEQARANAKQQFDTNRDLKFHERSALDEQVRQYCN